MGKRIAAIIQGGGTKEEPKWSAPLICGALFVIFVVLSVSSLSELHKQYRLHKDGIIALGMATAFEDRRSGHAVRYTFNAGSAVYEGVCPVKESWMEKTKLPAKIRVQFLREDPKVSQAPDAGEILIWSDVISGLFFLAGDFVLGAYVIATIGEVLGRRKSERMGMRAFDLPAYPKAWH
jgi:hypothetical protein